MILPPEDGCRNKLSRKSRAKAIARGQGKKKQRKQKPQPVANKSQKPKEAPKMARRGGLPIAAAASLDQLEQVNRNAAGIDLGATVHFVAVPPGRDPETHVRCFETFTADLQALADWLEQCGIETVAMESTGGAQAVTAVARKLAIIVYHMLKQGRPYKDQGAAYYEARYRERLVEGLRRRAKQLGLDVVSVATAP